MSEVADLEGQTVSTVLQLISAFLAMLGGLMISAYFIGKERLYRADRRIRRRLRDMAFRAWDYYTSIQGIAVVLWGRIGIALLVSLIVALFLVHTSWYPLRVSWLVVGVGIICLSGFLLRDLMPGVSFFLLLPLLGLIYFIASTIEVMFLFPVLRVNAWADRARIPYLVKLVGAACVVVSFTLYAVSYLF
jgi:hypothetical protein